MHRSNAIKKDLTMANLARDEESLYNRYGRDDSVLYRAQKAKAAERRVVARRSQSRWRRPQSAGAGSPHCAGQITPVAQICAHGSKQARKSKPIINPRKIAEEEELGHMVDSALTTHATKASEGEGAGPEAGARSKCWTPNKKTSVGTGCSLHPKRIGPSNSREYLLDKSRREKDTNEAFALQIQTERRSLESKLHQCCEAANVFCRLLGLPKSFELVGRGKVRTMLVAVTARDVTARGSAGGNRQPLMRHRRRKNDAAAYCLDSSTEPTGRTFISTKLFMREYARLEVEAKLHAEAGQESMAAADERPRGEGEPREACKQSLGGPTNDPTAPCLTHPIDGPDVWQTRAELSGHPRGSARLEYTCHSPGSPGKGGNNDAPGLISLGRAEMQGLLSRLHRRTHQQAEVLRGQLEEIHAKGWNRA